MSSRIHWRASPQALGTDISSKSGRSTDIFLDIQEGSNVGLHLCPPSLPINTRLLHSSRKKETFNMTSRTGKERTCGIPALQKTQNTRFVKARGTRRENLFVIPKRLDTERRGADTRDCMKTSTSYKVRVFIFWDSVPGSGQSLDVSQVFPLDWGQEVLPLQVLSWELRKVLKKKMRCAEGRKYPGEHSQGPEKQQHSYHYIYQVGGLTSATGLYRAPLYTRFWATGKGWNTAPQTGISLWWEKNKTKQTLKRL